MTRSDEHQRSSLNQWFYSKSRFHFQEKTEEIQLLQHAVSDEEVDVDSDIVETEPRVCSDAKNRNSPLDPVLDLVLEDSNEVVSENKTLSIPSPSTWGEFRVRFTKEECEMVSRHLPRAPTRYRSDLPEYVFS